MTDAPQRPRDVFVMRHAEKPASGRDSGLSPAGSARAHRLVDWVPRNLGTIDHLFASARTKESARAVETLQPLADSLGLTIDDSFGDAEFDKLAHHLRHAKKLRASTVLICWHHGEAPRLMHALEAPRGTYVDPWPEESFDLVFGIRYVEDPPAVTELVEPF